MKTKFYLIACLISLGVVSLAQVENGNFLGSSPSALRYIDPKKAPKPPPERQDLRVVQGKLYDASKSVLWATLTGECLEVRTNGVLLREIIVRRTAVGGSLNEQQSAGAYSSGPTFTQSYQPGTKKFFIRNYPLVLRPTPGRTIAARALRVGSIELDNRQFELWDYGTGYVPPRPIASAHTNAAAIGATNDVAATKQ